ALSIGVVYSKFTSLCVLSTAIAYYRVDALLWEIENPSERPNKARGSSYIAGRVAKAVFVKG
ncbi:MAG: hypothetical protein WBC94_16005, partial [Xanthobacteraceae bacterium]